jgi:hypothetical protein
MYVCIYVYLGVSVCACRCTDFKLLPVVVVMDLFQDIQLK